MRAFELPPAQWQRAGLSQLRMGFRRFGDLEKPRAVDGYRLRTYRPGDEEAWLSVLSRAGFAAWDRDRLDRTLAGERGPLPLEGIIFATKDDRPVGAANALLYMGESGQYSELGWLAVDPSHRGHGLGLEICRGVLNFAKRLGHEYTYLRTDDFRLPAIKTYLRLGFLPEEIDSTHAKRWRDLRSVLNVG